VIRVVSCALLALLLVSCAATPSPTASPTEKPLDVINVHNVDGPDVSVMLGERLLGVAPCGSGFHVWAADGVLPPLPWRITLLRSDQSELEQLDLPERPENMVVIRAEEAWAGLPGSVGPAPKVACPTKTGSGARPERA
jgi:hypothetical protein